MGVIGQVHEIDTQSNEERESTVFVAMNELVDDHVLGYVVRDVQKHINNLIREFDRSGLDAYMRVANRFKKLLVLIKAAPELYETGKYAVSCIVPKKPQYRDSDISWPLREVITRIDKEVTNGE